MPFVRISLSSGKPADYREAIVEGVYQAMRATFNVPEGDRFAVVHEHGEGAFAVDAPVTKAGPSR
jgi:4-oxalocrotonate tautomerase